MIGKRFERLVVLERVTSTRAEGIKYRCACDCGNVKVIHANNLRRSLTKSCGCMRREKLRERSTTHGMSKTHVYGIWNAAKGRCTNPSHLDYPDYGSRGVEFCERWKKFSVFIEDMGMPPTGMASIDRIDTNGNYEPGNCRWASQKQQANNKRNNRRFNHGNDSLTVAQLAELYNVPYTSMHRYLCEKHMSVSDVIEKRIKVTSPCHV